ncbi:hypothetical protein C2G38_2097867 [Gigaspora rosea]|uniref:Uncharacterized protein n=1 Tax=Gigaspora rosea TaxID=44941 RepID=A0A397UU35_9GLOM|nr:hypothetical protein C2G38_2097867 [Gigaspora rosea]
MKFNFAAVFSTFLIASTLAVPVQGGRKIADKRDAARVPVESSMHSIADAETNAIYKKRDALKAATSNLKEGTLARKKGGKRDAVRAPVESSMHSIADAETNTIYKKRDALKASSSNLKEGALARKKGGKRDAARVPVESSMHSFADAETNTIYKKRDALKAATSNLEDAGFGRVGNVVEGKNAVQQKRVAAKEEAKVSYDSTRAYKRDALETSEKKLRPKLKSSDVSVEKKTPSLKSLEASKVGQ